MEFSKAFNFICTCWGSVVKVNVTFEPRAMIKPIHNIIHTYIWLSMHWSTHTLQWEIRHRGTSEETSLLCKFFFLNKFSCPNIRISTRCIWDCLPRITDLVPPPTCIPLVRHNVHSPRAVFVSENLEWLHLTSQFYACCAQKHMFHFGVDAGSCMALQRTIYTNDMYGVCISIYQH